MCPRGTFSGEARNRNISDCLPCTAGYYCPVENMTSGDVFACGAGYSCPLGSIEAEPHDYPCTIGHSCPGNNAEPVPCSAGYYQDEIGQSACKVCVSGFYCPGTLSASHPNGTVLCPLGHYCALGSSTPEPCPRGSLAGHEGLPYCQPCPERYTCQQPGTIIASICPASYFCMRNNSSPEPCPMATYSNQTGLREQKECALCAPGRYISSLCLLLFSLALRYLSFRRARVALGLSLALGLALALSLSLALARAPSFSRSRSLCVCVSLSLSLSFSLARSLALDLV